MGRRAKGVARVRRTTGVDNDGPKSKERSQERPRLESTDQTVFAPQFPHRHRRCRPGRRRIAVRSEPYRQGGVARRHPGADPSDLGRRSRPRGGVSWASAAQAVNPRVHLGSDPRFGRRSRGSADVHRRPQRPDGVHVPRAPRRPVAGFAGPLHRHGGQRQQRRAAVRGDLPHGALWPRAVSLDQLRRPRDPEHLVGPVVRRRARSRCRPSSSSSRSSTC